MIIQALGATNERLRAFYETDCTLRFFTLILLTVQNSALVLFTKFSYRPSAIPYVPSTVVSFSECLKLFMSCALVVSSEGRESLSAALCDIPSNVFRLLLPSALYVLQNNLLFEGVLRLSPATYITCSQSKILTSAFFGMILLKTRITRQQSLALCLLTIGIVLVQSDSKGVITEARDSDRKATWNGVLIVFAASIISGFTGAYLEKIYKEVDVRRGKRPSIWFRNAQLACFSVPLAFFTVFWQDGRSVAENGMFKGYDSIVLALIMLQASGGLIVAAVMRYASNVLKCFAVSISICNCALLAKFVLGNQGHGMSTLNMVGVILVITATFCYTGKIKERLNAKKPA